MHELSSADVLAVWERGRTGSLPERALDLLAAAGDVAEPERMPVGERDARLLELRERSFGPDLDATATCPACGERLDVELEIGDLAVAGTGDGESLELATGERTLRFRMPTAADLVAVAAAADVDGARALLLERCVSEPPAGELASDEVDAIAARMAEADPGAWRELALVCPECGHDWTAPFDIVSFLCAEIDACALRLIRDVHALARAYGWREGDVLALSAARRAAYLELAGA
jgi:hypothetical protein